MPKQSGPSRYRQCKPWESVRFLAASTSRPRLKQKPSHDPNAFARNPAYPAGVQERAYHSKKAQGRVIQPAQNYDPAFTINTNPDAVNGPPVLGQDGTVLGGNSRAMSIARLYATEKGDVYRAKLLHDARLFGLDPKAVERMRQPGLVGELSLPLETVDDARRLASDLNRPFTGALGASEKAVSAGRSITPNTLQNMAGLMDQVGGDATVRDVLNRCPQEVLALLQRDGAISDRERPALVDPGTGGFSPEGTRFIERALLGSVVDDVGLLERTPASILNKVGSSVADLSKLMARAKPRSGRSVKSKPA